MNIKVKTKIISIFVAIIVSAMLFPGSTEGSIGTATSMDFGEVSVNSQLAEDLAITNSESIPVTLTFSLVLGGSCGFSYIAPGSEIEPNDTMVLPVTFSPVTETECTGMLVIKWKYYDEAGQPIDWGSTKVTLNGAGTEAPAVDPWVLIDGRDTNVENKLYEDKYISEWMDECAVSAGNHGQYVRCVALLTRKMVKAHVITRKEKRAIQKTAAHANIPPRDSGLEDLAYNGQPVTAWIDQCKESSENHREYKRCVSQLMRDMKKEGVITTRKQKHLIQRYAAKPK